MPNPIRLLGLSLIVLASTAMAQEGHVPDQIDYSMFFNADIRDTPECDVRVVHGAVDFGETISNPAMSCPDAFAWSLYAEVTAAGWWENWATDRQVWPSDPWPRCAPGESGKCCPAVASSNEIWPLHCPVFPGDAEGVPQYMVGTPFQFSEIKTVIAALRDRIRAHTTKWEDVPDVLKNAVIGAEQNELVYRNKAMVDYIFSRDLYYTEGLAGVYANFVKAIGAYTPRWPEPDNPLGDGPSGEGLVTVNFPITSIMLKINWLEVDQAESYGIDPFDPAHPFIVMDLVPQANDNAPPTGAVETKPFILLSMHISTKDVPNWFWATFEHVANQGRCDWIGCNDSFGYINTQTVEVNIGQATGLAPPNHNFTPPHGVTKVDDANQEAFDLAGTYVNVDQISDGLDAIFDAFGIGSASGINRSGRPTQQDQAWRSYRLKGTQTNFVGPAGRTTLLGNSVTEAGFVNSASCITCHARAGTTAEGLPPLSIFEDHLSDAGIPESSNGTPNEAWFNVNAYWGVLGEREAPDIRAIQTDFVWGFRNACPAKPRAIAPSWCANKVSAK